ncbi:MAG: class A beta-lactamase [Bryobacterales bacterium]|nr:class A beta-lactamase [Bryobacterales bacterium]
MRFVIWCALAFAASLSAQDIAIQILEREMARVAQAGGGVAGASAIHIESGRRAVLNPNEHFPMASTVKVPVAVQLLTLVDEGKERLDRMITLEAKDLHPGSGTLSDLFNKPGLALSVRNLLELMLLISDNSATDVVLRLAGGAEAVNARMRSLAVTGLRVDRPTVELIADAVGIKLPAEEQWSPLFFERAFRSLTPAARAAAMRTFNDDVRDTSTPDAMSELLVRIARKEVLKPDTGELLLDIMRRCRTGDTRIKGVLPQGTVVAHKTGSIAQSANDVGILTLPDGAGHVALSVFVKKSEKDAAARDRAIAEIARAVHDFFLFHPKPHIDYEKLAQRMVMALNPQAGEKFKLRPDPGYYESLLPALRRRLNRAGAAETTTLEDASIYLWLPLRPGGPPLPAAERETLRKWVDLGGSRRQLHFHWGEGSVYTDGLYGEHQPALDALYQDALDADTQEIGEKMDAMIARLRRGETRITTPAGTDIRFRLGDRPFNKQDGDASAQRMKSARTRIDRDIELPVGVLRVAPIEESVNGTVVIPEARFGPETARNVRLTFRAGVITKVEASANLTAVEHYLKQAGDAARRFREVGIGFNSILKPTPGSKVLPYYGYGDGVVRLSLGDNEEVGGSVRGGFVRWFFFPDAKILTK